MPRACAMDLFTECLEPEQRVEWEVVEVSRPRFQAMTHLLINLLNSLYIPTTSPYTQPSDSSSSRYLYNWNILTRFCSHAVPAATYGVTPLASKLNFLPCRPSSSDFASRRPTRPLNLLRWFPLSPFTRGYLVIMIYKHTWINSGRKEKEFCAHGLSS
jgi:hypothetical protein